jgi:hypothetical protein
MDVGVEEKKNEGSGAISGRAISREEEDNGAGPRDPEMRLSS